MSQDHMRHSTDLLRTWEEHLFSRLCLPSVELQVSAPLEVGPKRV